MRISLVAVGRPRDYRRFSGAIARNGDPVLDSGVNARLSRQPIRTFPQLIAAGFACAAPAAAPLGATYTRYRSALTRPDKSLKCANEQIGAGSHPRSAAERTSCCVIHRPSIVPFHPSTTAIG